MKTIDCTPTWVGLLPLMLDLYFNRNTKIENRKDLTEEFKKMAQAADNWNNYVKTVKEN